MTINKKTGSDWYQCVPDSYTTLLFGEVALNKKPALKDIFFGKEAYEAYAVYAYLKQLIQIKSSGCDTEANKYFIPLYWAIKTLQKEEKCTLVELGSTLFSSIDRLMAADQLVGGNLKFKDVDFIGVELSDFFANVADMLHSDSRINISHYSKIEEIPITALNNCVTLSYQASSYMFSRTKDLVEFLSKSKFGVNHIWFSTSNKTETVSAFGKRLTLFSLEEFISGLRGLNNSVVFIDAQEWRHPDFTYYATWCIDHKLSTDQLNNLGKLCLEHVQHDFEDNADSFFEKELEKVDYPLKKAKNKTSTENMFNWNFPEVYSAFSSHLKELGQNDRSDQLLKEANQLPFLKKFKGIIKLWS